MLSTSVIKNVGQASHYYSQQDNYYTQEQGVEQSEWWGKGAENLALSGNVDAKQFTDLLLGKLYSGEQLGKVVDGQIKHRPGWDLTFSAPKSVSILALIGGDKRLIDAHRQAVAVALSHIERSCGQARYQTSEGITYQNTKNIIAALFHHDLSRAKDPQLHTHSVVMNMTERLDGKWRSLASTVGNYDEKAQGEINGFIERVRHHNRYFSKLYETELAFRIKELGYEITTDTKSGIFEIAGVSNDAVQFFSKRRADIEKKLTEKGLSGGKAAAIATLDTRDAKEDVDRAYLKERWEKEAKQLGLNYHSVIEKSYQSKLDRPVAEHVIDEQCLSALHHAAKALSQFQSTFTLEEVVTVATEYAIRQQVNVEPLLKAAETLITSGELLSLPNDRGKTLLMTQSTLDDEKNVFSHTEQNKSGQSVISSNELNNLLERHNDISVEHHGNLKTIFGDDRIVLIEGEIARTTLIEPIMKITKSAKQNVVCLSPSLIGSKQFANKVKQEPMSFWEQIKALFIDSTPKHYSVMQFLSEFSENNISKNEMPQVILIENAHLLSTHQQSRLFEWNKVNDTKLILFGNKRTLLSQHIGVSFHQLNEHGVPLVSIQSKEESLAKDIEEGNIKTVVEKMAGRIVEVKHDDDRHLAMTTHFSQLNDNERKQSWLVAHNKQTVNDLNLLAHQSLLSQGKLGKTEDINVLIPIFIPDGKGVLATTYQKGHMVRFNESYSKLHVNRGEYLRVVRHSKVSNRVVLQKENGTHVVWQPDKIAGGTSGKVELFNEIQREFAVNEIVIANRSLKSKGIVKGERLFLYAINKRNMVLKNQDGKSIFLDLSKPYHRQFDYGYATTLHSIAHEKPNVLIAELPARSFHTDQRRFYQAVSQPKEAWIYTNDQPGLLTMLEKKTGDRLTVHETISKAEEIKKNLHGLYDVLEKQIIKHEGDKNTDPVKKAIDAIDYAMRHLSEREAGFTHKDLMTVAMNHAIGNVTEKMLTQVAVEMEKTGVLLRGERFDGTLWTTADAVKIEKEILSLATKDQGKFQPIVTREELSNHTELNNLRPEQVATITAITQSPDRVLSIQGRAGTGKTTMMVTLADVIAAKEMIEANGYSLYCIAPTHKAVKELKSRGLAAQTVDSFLLESKQLLENKQQHDFSRTLLVVDEASMVSNRNMLAVLKVGHDLDFRSIIPTGDTEQNPSIESGKPHDLIQKKLDTTVYLEDIQRQKNSVLKEAVKAIYQGDVAKTFSVLCDSIIEINAKSANDPADKNLKPDELRQKYYQKRVEMIANDYISLLQKGENVQIIAPSHADRKAVNEQVRVQLNELNMIKGDDHSLSILSSNDMTGVERSKAVNFKANQILRFTVSTGKNIKAGDYFTITKINKQHNILTLIKEGSNKEIIWQVPSTRERINNTIEVFQQEDRTLKIGDKIVWTRTNRKEGTLSADVSEVIHIEKNQITVKRHDNSISTFNAGDKKYQHWDHAYAITTYGSQGGTYSTILAIFESYREKLMNLKNLLVTITRPENGLRIYTNSKSDLQNTIQGNKGDKKSSLEVIGEYPEKAARGQKNKTTLSDKSLSFSKANKTGRPYFDRPTIQKIKEGLNKDAEQLAIDILGTPKEKGSNYLKFGSNQGSLTVTTKGEKQGWFNDFETNQGGRDMLKFIQVHGGMTRDESLQFGADRIGILYKNGTKKLEAKHNANVKSAAPAKENTTESFSDYEKRRIRLANKIAKESLPLKGTLAEKYLKDYRGINLDRLPEDIRFHPSVYSKKNQKALPALIAIARNYERKIQAVEAIYLDPKTGNKADVSLSKQTIGSKKGASVMINQTTNENAPTLIAEGVATGLSLAKSLPDANVNITLGKQMFAKLDPRTLQQKIIFCLDNDGKDLKKDDLVLKAADRLVAHKKDVSFMVPNGLEMKKQDYNDILKHRGSEAIQNDYRYAISYNDFYKNTGNAPNISPERMTQFSKKISNKMDDQTKTQLSAYQSMMRNNQQLNRETTLSRMKEIEREI